MDNWTRLLQVPVYSFVHHKTYKFSKMLVHYLYTLTYILYTLNKSGNSVHTNKNQFHIKTFIEQIQNIFQSNTVAGSLFIFVSAAYLD